MRTAYTLNLALLLAFVASLSTADATERQPVRSLREIRQAGVVIQKWETSCAAAALATVLTYHHNYPVPEKFVTQAMLRSTDPIKVKVRGGFSLLDMKRFVESRGFHGMGLKGLEFKELLELDSPIVPIDRSGNAHFIVVRGLTADGRVDIADPGFGNDTMDVERFKSMWTNGIAFVVSR
jgi:predicted double-glycine peptidase